MVPESEVVPAGLPRLSPLAWQGMYLFAVDTFANGVDYAFHVYLGRALSTGDFAVVQSLNAALLIVLATCGVLQPAVARQVAAARAAGNDRSGTIFRAYFTHAAFLGAVFAGALWLLRVPVAAWLNVPPLTVGIAAFIIALAFLRPVLFGVLQGREQFVAFGGTRAAFAVGRLSAAFLLVGLLAGGAAGGVWAMVAGMAVSVAFALVWIAPRLVMQEDEAPAHLVREGWRLSLAALAAYAAYMSLLNIDLIWVNRAFDPNEAGTYAAAVVFRRVLSLLPGAVLVILYPRVVAAVAAGRLPDRPLARATIVIVLSSAALTAIYFMGGGALVSLLFGARYPAAAPLLGWMGIAMTGYGIAGAWLNLFLATRPWPYVALLGAVTAALTGLFFRGAASLAQVTLLFGAAGWALALGGLVLYLFWLRPRLGAERADATVPVSEI